MVKVDYHKRQRFVTALLSALLCTPGVRATPALDQGLVLHYTFTGNSRDQSPSANHATPFNGAVLTTDRFGLPSRAFKFNGTSAYLQAAQPLPESDSLTISLWFSLDKWMPAFVAPQVIFFEGDDGPGRDVTCYIAAGFYLTLKSDTGARYENWLPPTNSWTHLVCVADAPAGQASIWINGQLVGQSPFAGNANAGFHAPFNLARRPGGFNDWFFAGNIDDVRVYNRPLNTAEITHLHNLERGVTKSLDIDIEVLRLTLNVIPGRRYILQSSDDLKSWTTYGEPFVATTATLTTSVNIHDQGRYWRLLEQSP